MCKEGQRGGGGGAWKADVVGLIVSNAASNASPAVKCSFLILL